MVRPDSDGGGPGSVDLFPHHQPSGSSVASEGTSIQATAGDVQSFSTDVKGKHNNAKAGVAGLIAVSMQSAPDEVIANANNLVGTIMSGGGTIMWFGDRITDFDGTVSSLNTQILNEPQDKRPQKKSALQPQYATAVQSLSDQGKTAVSRLKNPLDPGTVTALYAAGAMPSYIKNAFPSVDFTGVKLQKLPPDLAGKTPQEQADYVKNNKGIDPQIAALIDPEAKIILADEVAQDVKDKKVDGDTTYLLGLYKEDAAFAHEMYTKITPDDMADVIRYLSDSTFPPGTAYDPADQAQKAKLYADFLALAGVTLATYTKGTGQYAPPPDLAESWYKAITDEKNPENAAALTMLIKHGGHEAAFDPVFLSDLTDKVYDWERSHDGDPVWRPLSERLGQYGAIKDPSYNFGDPNNPYDDRASYTVAYDGLANLLGGMEKTPHAGELFFGDSPTCDYEGEQVNDKLHYLLTDRVWPTDDGDGFGKALEGATTFSRGDDPAGNQSAQLASQMVRMIAGESGDSNGIKFIHDWHLPEGMTDSVGNIAASYVNDLIDSSQGEGDAYDISGGDWTRGGAGDPFGIRASKDDWGKLLFELGQNDDKTGLQTVVTAAVVDNNGETSAILGANKDPNNLTIASLSQTDGNDASIMTKLTDQATRSGNALNFIFDNGIKGGHDGEEADQTRRELFSKAFGVATDFVPSPTGKVLSVLTSEGLSQLNDAIGKEPASVTDAWSGDSKEAMKTQLKYGTYNALIDNGYLNPKNDPEYGLDPKFVVDNNGQSQIDPKLYNGVPGDVTNGTSSTVTSKDLEDQFQTWLEAPDPKHPGASSPNSVFEPFLSAYAGAAIK